MSDDKYIFKKFWISQLKKGSFADECLNVKNENVYRVNLIATVVSKFISEDNNYSAVVIDDGTSTIRAKAWRDDVAKFKNLEEGDLINIFAGVHSYQDEVYLSPSIIRKVSNPNWELHRLLELLKLRGKPDSSESAGGNKEDSKVKPPKNRVFMDLIRKLDTGHGAELNLLVEKSGLTKEQVIEIARTLMDEGDVYEPEPNKLKVLE